MASAPAMVVSPSPSAADPSAPSPGLFFLAAATFLRYADRLVVCVSLNSVLGSGVRVSCRELILEQGDLRGKGRGWNQGVLANSASTRSRMKPYSMSSNALKTSAGMIVFLLWRAVTSLALF